MKIGLWDVCAATASIVASPLLGIIGWDSAVWALGGVFILLAGTFMGRVVRDGIEAQFIDRESRP